MFASQHKQCWNESQVSLPPQQLYLQEWVGSIFSAFFSWKFTRKDLFIQPSVCVSDGPSSPKASVIPTRLCFLSWQRGQTSPRLVMLMNGALSDGVWSTWPAQPFPLDSAGQISCWLGDGAVRQSCYCLIWQQSSVWSSADRVTLS